MLDDGTILLGYGDWNTNTGPIDLLDLDPDTGTVTTLVDNMPTEAIVRFRVLNSGHVWVPSIDPTGANPGTLATNAGGTWDLLTVEVPGLPVATHLFDVAQTADDTLYVAGSRHITVGEGNTEDADYDCAFVWKSTDDGATWTEDLVYYGTGTEVQRFRGIGKVGNDLYVSTTSGAVYWRLHAGAWTEHAATLGGYPSAWGTDRFSVQTLPAKLYGAGGAGLLTQDTTTVPDLFFLLAAAGDRYLYVTAAAVLVDTETGILGSLADPSTWRGAYAPDGTAYLCDGTRVYRVET